MSPIEAIIVEQEGVEFYTDAATGKSGICGSGLSVLCGVTKDAVSKLMKSLYSNKPYKGLEHLVDKALSLSTKSETGMMLLADELCVAIIKYYAYKGNETAQFTLDKFVALGFNAWVQSITGWQPPADLAPIAPEVIQEVTELKSKMTELDQRVQHLQHNGKRRFWVKTREEALLYYPEECVDSFKSDLGGYHIDLKLVESMKSQPMMLPPIPEKSEPVDDPKYKIETEEDMKAFSDKFYKERGVNWNKKIGGM